MRYAIWIREGDGKGGPTTADHNYGKLRFPAPIPILPQCFLFAPVDIFAFFPTFFLAFPSLFFFLYFACFLCDCSEIPRISRRFFTHFPFYIGCQTGEKKEIQSGIRRNSGIYGLWHKVGSDQAMYTYRSL